MSFAELPLRTIFPSDCTAMPYALSLPAVRSVRTNPAPAPKVVSSEPPVSKRASATAKLPPLTP